MVRPTTDIEAGRKLLLDTIDSLIQEKGAIDISMTELAAKAGMSPGNIYRFFESKEALFEAVAEGWFADRTAIMEAVVGSDLPVREKMYEFYARRYIRLSAYAARDPELFQSYCELGKQHFEVVRGYIDLGDHYLSLIVAEAMEDGFFASFSIDDVVSLINQMVSPYCNPEMLISLDPYLSEKKLKIIIDTIFIGLSAQKNSPDSVEMSLVN